MTKDAINAWDEVQDDEHPVNYIVLTFSKKSKKKVVVRAKGAGGLMQALEHVNRRRDLFRGMQSIRDRCDQERGSRA